MNYKNHTRCRVCQCDDLKPYLDLGLMPLSNNLAETAEDPIHDQKYPLKVLFCEQCGLSQLSIVIPAEEMFSNYVYRSSINRGYLDHCARMATYLRGKYKLSPNSWHIDIAGNDGGLLREFKKVVGSGHLLNVDPAKNLVPLGVNGLAGCDADKIQYYTVFWGEQAGKHLKSVGWMADLITATNVFAHVDDVTEFLQAVKMVLKPTGVLVLEFPYLIDFLEKNEFDTVYFEHLSYFSIYPLTLLCQKVGLNVMSVSKHEIHGGSVRVEIGYGHQDESVAPYVMQERHHYRKLERYQQFAQDVDLSIRSFAINIRELKGTVAGFAASAKGNTLLNCAQLGRFHIQYIVDETPEKLGRWSPGVRIPIVSIRHMMEAPPDYLVILSWNFSGEIIAKCRKAGYRGKFILPIPEFKVLSPAVMA
jgi:ubiquinone/menaquinone biosynthesis C-methylase UbiE